jgi:fructosamine-3-kinase
MQRPGRYTEEEWRYLVEPWEHAWPEGWREIRDVRERWAPTLRAICERHGLAFDEGYEYAFGSHAVYLFETFVVKIYARYSPVWYPREVEALAVLGDEAEVHAPRLIGHDDADRGTSGHPYIVIERLPGDPWRIIRDDGSEAERLAAVRQMARAARAMHAVDVGRLHGFERSADEWVAKVRARAAIAPGYLKGVLPDHLLAEVEPYLADHLDAITPDFTPTFICTDINSSNSLFVRDGDTVRMSGQVDYGDVEIGPLEYEWPSVVQKALRHRPELVAAFFDAYGVELPFADDVVRRLKVLSLLHRFPTLESFAEEHPEARSLDELLELQWACTRR